MESHLAERIKISPGFWEGLRQLGISAQDIARKARLPLTVMTDSAGVTADHYFAIWEAYSDLIGNTAEGIIKLAAAFETAKYPPAVLAIYHARDYRDALYRMARYKQLCPPERLRIAENGEDCSIELEWLSSDRPGPPVLIGITLAALLEFGRRGTGRLLAARSVEFTHSMGNIQALEAYFGCRVRVGAERNRMTLFRSDLDLPFVSYNEELLEVLTPALDQSLNEQQRKLSLIEKVKQIIKNGLSGRPDIQTVAYGLGMSGRTLQRRLADEGATFKHLLAQARHEQAKAYLADPSLDIKEVAFLIGYEDQNSFYRAFRLWEGDTPSHWRSLAYRSESS
ncbi:AraC family transcriptional regulator [Paenibacillus nanensis]|uniref:AraC family transcriptional regulator n=1 Tax=Paenibacillus nanensis TaxID=393251 RepID=A0A3A1ULZ3_9BACL|nr:AraC family transcriptional regulator [Paenibacillus nanensis]RIX48754.1 AraC family transcriptional regulator [Paenibacillus nanensis]